MRKTVCIDVDGTLADYSNGWQGHDHIGDPLPGAVEFTKAVHAFADVLIYTTRCCEDMGRGMKAPLLRKFVQEWLDKHNFVYDDIWVGQGKPICACFVDDRAVYCAPQALAEDMAKTGVPTEHACKFAYAQALHHTEEFCGSFVHLNKPPEENNSASERTPTSMYETSAVQA